MFAAHLRRAAHFAPAFAIVPFDACGAGVGEIAHAVAIEPARDRRTVLVLCAESERAHASAAARCRTALDAFMHAYAAAESHTLTAALLAGMEAANAALYDRRAGRSHQQAVGVGLTALLARDADGYIAQVGQGQALVVGADGITALPPLSRSHTPGGGSDDRAIPAPLGRLPEIEPDLYHIDAGDGLFAVLCHSALGRVFRHEDETAVLSRDPQGAAAFFVTLGGRFRLPEAYGVVVSAGDAASMPDDLLRSVERASSSRHAPDEIAPSDAPGTRGRASAAVLPDLDEPRWDYLGDPDPAPLMTNGARKAGPDVRLSDGQRAGHRFVPRALPPRAWVLISAVAFTVVFAALLGIVHAIGAHRADGATLRELNEAALTRERAMALRDTQAAYTALIGVSAQLDRIATEGRETQRVAQERRLTAGALDAIERVTRVTPATLVSLPHDEGDAGAHRLLIAGDDGKLYLFVREKNDWGVDTVDPATGKSERLFATGGVVNKVPAGDLRGLFWAGGPATTDRTRLFSRSASGAWSERALPALGAKRPTAIAPLGDALYMLDAGAGLIARVPLADGSPAKAWTNDAAAAELRSAVDMASDGAAIWVLMADGRVRSYRGGAPGMLIVPDVVPPVDTATAIATSAGSLYLYVAEESQGRILRIRKADGHVVQVLRAADGAAPLSGVQSLTVDEARGKLWLVSADAILTIPLPLVGGA